MLAGRAVARAIWVIRANEHFEKVQRLYRVATLYLGVCQRHMCIGSQQHCSASVVSPIESFVQRCPVAFAHALSIIPYYNGGKAASRLDLPS